MQALHVHSEKDLIIQTANNEYSNKASKSVSTP